MKKAKKTVLLAASACVVLGLIIVTAGFAALDFDIAKLNPVRLTEHSYPVKETFDSILIESGQCNVCLLPSADGSCEVVCRAAENLSSHVSVKDGVLTVQESDERAWYEHLLGGWERMRLEIMLPQSAYQSLTITSASGDVQVPEGFRFANAQITTASGGVSFLAEVEGTLSVQTTSGDISAAKAQPQNLQLTTASGRIALDRIISTGALRAESVSGDVILQGCDADSLHIQTVSGSISGTLLSQKAFETTTASGSVRVPSGGSGGRCEAETVSGDIALYLSGEQGR